MQLRPLRITQPCHLLFEIVFDQSAPAAFQSNQLTVSCNFVPGLYAIRSQYASRFALYNWTYRLGPTYHPHVSTTNLLGQTELFTWSASGAIITDAVASSFPTVVGYIIDTPQATAPVTFMSNIVYACR